MTLTVIVFMWLRLGRVSRPSCTRHPNKCRQVGLVPGITTMNHHYFVASVTKRKGKTYLHKERLKSSLRKFYGRYGDLTKQYEVSLSRMLHDILDDGHIQ